MATADNKVMSLVERELKKDPTQASQALYAKAQKIDSEIGRLTLRQFHAKYPLQVKRRQAGGKSRTRKTKAKSRKTQATKRTAAGRAKRSTTRRSGRRAATRATSAGGGDDAVRRALLKFAREISAAEGKTETIEVLANVDRYVSDIVKASRG
ncbi:MAG: hypothetical protein ACRELC_07055 [Gemmatimonadota bacterium]